MQKIRTHRGWTFRFIEKCNDYPNAIPMFMAIGVGPTDNAVGGWEPLKSKCIIHKSIALIENLTLNEGNEIV